MEETIDVGEGIQNIASEAIDTGETLGKWYLEFNFIKSAIVLVIVVLILLIFLAAMVFGTPEKLTSEVGVFDRDSLEVKEQLCIFDLLQNRPRNHRVTRKEVEYCRRRAKLMNDNEVDRLYCEHNTYIREMAKRKTDNYKLSTAEREACWWKHGPHGQRYN